MNVYELHINNYAIRNEMYEGRKHIVVPAIIMREGVHCGSAGPLLHLADELGRFSGAWDGIPVTIHHPEKDGVPVSANIPDVLERYKVGRIFNTMMDGDKLRSEVWVDEEKIKSVSPETLRAIINRRPLDVSVGVFTDEEEMQGVYNNEEYTAIARNHRPDHLALLPGAQGACSWADGCGIRNHQKGGDSHLEITNNALSYRGTETTAWSAPTLADFDVSESSWEALSQSEKSKVASHFMIGSASADTFGDLHFPVVNPATGRLNENALRAVISGRGAQLTAVPANVRDAARRRAYRLLNSEFDAELEIPETLSVNGQDQLISQLKKSGLTVIQINADPGYNEIVGTLQGKLDSMDTDTRIHFLQEVYEGYFIYEVRNQGESKIYQREYSIDENGSIEIMGEPEEVVREITYKPSNNNKGGVKAMCDANGKCADAAAKVDCIIKNNSHFEEGDRQWLTTLSEEQIDKIAATEEKVVEVPAEPQMNKDQAIEVLKDHLSDPEKFMGLLPDEVRAQMQYGLGAYKSKRAELVNHITTNSEVFAAEELDGKDMDELTKLAQVVKPKSDYSLHGGIQTHSSTNADDILPPAGVEFDDK